MSKQTTTLNEIDLNTTFIGKTQMNSKKRTVEECCNRLAEITGYIESGIDSELDKVSCWFEETYVYLIRVHDLKGLRTLVKQHLILIVKLINGNQTTQATKHITSLYNHTNIDPIKNNISDILVSDFTQFNIAYLSSLKVLVLQLILKRKLGEHYMGAIIEMFSNDERYLLVDEKFKVGTILKLLLNFYTILPKYKILFGLKFLQYLKQYDIPFESYIKNMSREQYQKQLIKSARKTNGTYEKYFNSFYIAYSKYCNTIDKIMVRDILNSDGVREKILKDNKLALSLFDLDVYSIKYYCLSFDELKTLLSTILKINILFDSGKTEKSLSYLLCIWKTLKGEGYELTKVITKLMDKTIIFINDINEMNKTLENLTIELSDCLVQTCLNKNLLTPITNITTVLFNLSLKLKNEVFLKEAVKYESLLTMKYGRGSWVMDSNRINRMLSGTSSLSFRHHIFQRFFNIFMFSNITSLDELYGAIETLVKSSKNKLRQMDIITKLNCSNIMYILLFNFLGKETPEKYLMDGTSKLLVSCLSGKSDIDVKDINNYDGTRSILSESYNFLKCVYLLNYDISRSTTNYVIQIAVNISTNASILTGAGYASPLKDTFIKNLLVYLDLNQYDKVIMDLYDHLTMIDRSIGNMISFLELVYLRALIRLQYSTKIDKLYTEFINGTVFNEAGTSLDNLLIAFEFGMWYKSINIMDDILCKVPKTMLDTFLDYKSNENLSVDNYLLKLIVNVKYYRVIAAIDESAMEISDAISNAKLSLQLVKSILKKDVPRKHFVNFLLIDEMIGSLTQLLYLFCNLGLEKDALFYSKELTTHMCKISYPRVVYSIFMALIEFYELENDTEMIILTKDKSNATFDFINGEHDISSTLMFFYTNKEYKKINESLQVYFGSNIKETLLHDYWMLKLGEVLILAPNRYESWNSVNKIQNSYASLLDHIELNPTFRGLNESVLSTHFWNMTKARHHDNLDDTPSNSSPGTKKSSNMTPKRKNLTKDFDKRVLIRKLQTILEMINAIDPIALNRKNQIIISNVFIICSILLNSTHDLELTAYTVLLEKVLELKNITSTLPVLYEKQLSIKNIDRGVCRTNLHKPSKQGISLDFSVDVLFDKANWDIDIVQLDYCSISNSLVITKLSRQNRKLQVVKVPLNRGISRDPDNTELTFEDAKRALEDIVNSSNMSITKTVTDNIKTKTDRHDWWEKRYELDSRLRDICDKIEQSWINGLKGLLSGHYYLPEMVIAFRNSFDSILEQVLPSRKNGECKMNKVELEDWVLSLFLDLEPTDKDFLSSLEDLIYFVLDILLYRGEENAYDEIDFGLMHVLIEEQIRTLQLEYTSKKTSDHTFLVIGTLCHNIPWESLSFFRGRSTSRVPSLEVLFKLLESNNFQLPVTVDKKERVSMIVNPNSDLTRTENNFKGKFLEMERSRPNSKLIINQKPTEQEFLECLMNSNVFVYIGHGGGEQYIRHSLIKQNEKLPPVFLLGCSSASMKEKGVLQSPCVTYSYLIGNSCMVLGNLWDVTDKDIDKFSLSVFEKTSLTELSNKNESVTTTEAVANSRDTCHLKYLNGAAPVIYGLPVIFI